MTVQNVVLVIPPASLENSYGDLKDFSNPQPSIGLAYIAAVLRENGFNPSIIDAYLDQTHPDKVVEEVLAKDPQVVGISVLTPAYFPTSQIVKGIRAAKPDCKIVLGNLHAAIFVEDCFKDGIADYIVHREGEYTMLELCQKLRDGEDVGDVLGISYQYDGMIINNPDRPVIEADELDKLPYPAWDLYPLHKYKTDPRTEVMPGAVEMQVLATRGCPSLCTFCSSRTDRSQGMGYRKRDPVKIVDEIEYMHERYGSKVFAFVDLAFPLAKKHAIATMDEIIRRGLHKKIKWVSECRVRPLDKETLEKIKEAGCARLNFGIESGSDDILEILKKNFTTDDVRRAVQMCHEVGIEVDGMMMIGLPTETEEHIQRTIDFTIELGLRFAIFNLFVPYPGCDLWDTLMAQKKISWNNWSEFTSYPTYAGARPVYTPDDLSHEKMMKLQDRAMRSFYLRPKFIWDEIKRFKPSMIGKYFRGLRGILTGGGVAQTDW